MSNNKGSDQPKPNHTGEAAGQKVGRVTDVRRSRTAVETFIIRSRGMRRKILPDILAAFCRDATSPQLREAVGDEIKKTKKKQKEKHSSPLRDQPHWTTRAADSLLCLNRMQNAKWEHWDLRNDLAKRSFDCYFCLVLFWITHTQS